MSTTGQKAGQTPSDAKGWLSPLFGMLSLGAILIAIATSNYLFLLAGLAFVVVAHASRRTMIWVAFVALALMVVGAAWLWLGTTVRIPAMRMESANNLHQIGIALHDYEVDHGHLPPQVLVGSDGQPLLSWRVLILPYLEQEDLFRRFRLNEPWDSPHNVKLLDRMPKIYAPVRRVDFEPNCTFYQAFVGPGAAFEHGRTLKSADFGDGPSNTLMVVEAGEAVPWTKPADVAVDPNEPIPPLGGNLKGKTGWFESARSAGFNALFADGHIRFFVADVAGDEKLRALITRAGGEKVDLDDFLP
jgi:prepilin-type processing-associated H-X9-DG protein